MKLTSYRNPHEFLRDVEAYLLENETENNLILSLVYGKADKLPNDHVANPDTYLPYFAAVTDELGVMATDGNEAMNSVIHCCAWSTIEERVGITSSTSDQALKKLASDVSKTCVEAIDFMGPEPGIKTFADLVARKQKRRAELQKSLRYYAAEQRDMQKKKSSISGGLRLADTFDLDLVTKWIYGFSEEADEICDPRAHAEARIAEAQIYLWEHHGAKAMAAWGGKTPLGVRIGLVYTPPEYRRRGYGTACVAALTQLLFDRGNRYCALFTESENAASNAVYQKIGYQLQYDAGVYRLQNDEKSE